MIDRVRVVCQQLAPDVDRPQDNSELATRAVSEALESRADVIVLPELVTSGYVFRSRGEASASALPASSALFGDWARLLAPTDSVLVAGFAELGDDGEVYNSAALVTGEGVLAVYRKLHLWDEEKLWFRAGDDSPPVVPTRFGKIGLSICYDIEFPETIRGLALRRADIVVVPTNWPLSERPANERPPEMTDAASAARLNGVYVVCCDRTGTERGVRWTGGSCIVGPDGWLLAERPDRDAGPVLADIEPARARTKSLSPRNDIFSDRRPEHYGQIVAEAAQADSSPSSV